MIGGGSDVSGPAPSSLFPGREEGGSRIDQLASEVRHSGLFCTPRDVERLLAVLQSTSSIWELAQRSAVPLLVICQLLDRMHQLGWIAYEGDRIELTEAGQRACRTAQVAPFRLIRCPRCQGRGIDLAVLGDDVRQAFTQIAADRPTAIRDYDQAYMVEEATLARVAFLWSKGDLSGKDLLIIGDDDLVSIAAALTREPHRIVVLEVDERLIHFIQTVARQYELKVEARVYNVCDPLPAEYHRVFDTFVCDPSESFGGLQAFLTRCLLGLKGEGAAGVFGLSRHEASLRKWHRLQRWLNDQQAVCTDIRTDFSQYQNWPYVEEMRAWSLLPVRYRPDKPWYQSALLRIELLGRPEIHNEPFSPDVFMDEEAATF